MYSPRGLIEIPKPFRGAIHEGSIHQGGQYTRHQYLQKFWMVITVLCLCNYGFYEFRYVLNTYFWHMALEKPIWCSCLVVFMPVEIIFDVNYAKIMGFLVYSPRGGGGKTPGRFQKQANFGAYTGGAYKRGLYIKHYSTGVFPIITPYHTFARFFTKLEFALR